MLGGDGELGEPLGHWGRKGWAGGSDSSQDPGSDGWPREVGRVPPRWAERTLRPPAPGARGAV